MLKIVVTILGIAILAMTGVIIATAINRMGDSVVDDVPREPAPVAAETPAPVMPAPPVGSSWTLVLLPDGTGEIVESAVSGTVLRVVTENAGTDRRIHLIDMRTGRRIGEVRAQ